MDNGNHGVLRENCDVTNDAGIARPISSNPEPSPLDEASGIATDSETVAAVSDFPTTITQMLSDDDSALVLSEDDTDVPDGVLFTSSDEQGKSLGAVVGAAIAWGNGLTTCNRQLPVDLTN